MSSELLSRILHLPASGPSETSPLSADVYAIRGETAWWIFDVGACDEAADFVNSLPCDRGEGTAPLQKNIVISHFHRDHAFNLSRVRFDRLFVGRETFRHCDATIQARRDVTVVESPVVIEDGLRFCIEPIPSSHAKGSLMLTVGGDESACDAANPSTARDETNPIVAFLGDSTYPTVGHGKPDSYNVQLLFQQIQFLRACEARNFYMSHRRFVPREKESVLQILEGYYAQRQPNKNLIEVSR